MFSRKWLLTLGLAASMLLPSNPAVHADLSPVAEERAHASSDQPAPSPPVGPAGKALVASHETTPVGPGMSLTRFDRFDARGWMRGYVLRVDLTNPAVSADLLHPGAMAKAEPLSAYAARAGAVAAVNADFFDINNTKASLGVAVQSGELLKSGISGWTQVVGVGQDGVGRLAQVLLEGTITLPTGELPLGGLNQLGIASGAIGLYTPLWGTTSRKDVASGAVREVTVVDGKVAANTPYIGSGPIPANGYVLIGRDAGAAALAGLSGGDPVSVRYQPRTDAASPFHFAVGGNWTLVNDGELQNLEDKDLHPRTAAGFTADGRTMILVAVDGRIQSSRGATLKELGEIMAANGAYNALNLDGGGSTTLLTRLPGEPAPAITNQPSDGSERPVPNGIGIFAAPGSGSLTGLRVRPASGAEHAERVFPGLSRTFVARGYDEHYGPVDAGAVTWAALPADVGSFTADGVFVGQKPGSAVAHAQVNGVKGAAPLRVLGALDRLESSPGRIGMDPGSTATFTVVGYDAEGHAAPIEPRDVSLTYDDSVIRIEAAADGAYRVTPLTEGGSVVTIRAGSMETYLPVTVGLATMPAAGFEDPAAWSLVKFPAQVGATMSFVPGRTGQAAQLDYNFATTTASRAAYVQANPLLELPGQPLKVGLWVKGDGKGAWLRMILRDSVNTNYTVNLAGSVDWTGWRYVETAVPPGVQYPLRLYRIYPVETNRNKQYTGSLQFDDLVVRVPATLEVPERPALRDPLFLQNERLDGSRWKFAILSDLHIAGNSPDSKDVRNTRTALRQALASNPDFIVISGDFVDTAYPQDFALAKQILAEEVGDKVPVWYIPGNHEIAGTGNLANFTAAFGENRYTFDHKGTRFILLDSSTGSYRTADFEQLVELEQSLAGAAQDPGIKNVVVVGHHPTRDPMPTASSQLSDQREARLVEQYLTQFRESSGGKGAIYIAGHAHTVDARRVEGVNYLVLGSVGKTPYGPADEGGFFAWTLMGIDPTPMPVAHGHSGAWIQAEVRPILDSISLYAPSTVAAGSTVAVSATGNQAAGRTLPLRYPATVHWSGSSNLFVGSGDAAERAARTGSYAATFDPGTGDLKALKEGAVVVQVEANGVAAETTIQITR